MSVVQIAKMLGTTKSTFLRVKRETPKLKAAYDRGLEKRAVEKGMVVMNVGNGASWVLPVGHKPAETTLSPEQQFARRAKRIVDHLMANPSENSFRDIRNATALTSDEISEAMAFLILNREIISAVRDPHDDDFRYSVRPAWERHHMENNGRKSGGRKSTGIPHPEARRQATRISGQANRAI